MTQVDVRGWRHNLNLILNLDYSPGFNILLKVRGFQLPSDASQRHLQISAKHSSMYNFTIYSN